MDKKITKNSIKIINQKGIQFEEQKLRNSNFQYEPDQHVINFILSYAKALSVRKSKYLGTIEMILN